MWSKPHNPNPIPFIQGYLCAPVIKGSRYVDLLSPSSPTDDRGSSLRTGLNQIIQIRGEFLLSRSLDVTQHCLSEGLFLQTSAFQNGCVRKGVFAAAPWTLSRGCWRCWGRRCCPPSCCWVRGPCGRCCQSGGPWLRGDPLPSCHLYSPWCLCVYSITGTRRQLLVSACKRRTRRWRLVVNDGCWLVCLHMWWSATMCKHLKESLKMMKRRTSAYRIRPQKQAHRR